MAFLTQAARKNALDGLTINYVLLHDGVPGDTGASNQITGTEQSITLAAATDYQTNDAQRQPSADIEYTELNANQKCNARQLLGRRSRSGWHVQGVGGVDRRYSSQ